MLYILKVVLKLNYMFDIFLKWVLLKFYSFSIFFILLYLYIIIMLYISLLFNFFWVIVKNYYLKNYLFLLFIIFYFFIFWVIPMLLIEFIVVFYFNFNVLIFFSFFFNIYRFFVFIFFYSYYFVSRWDYRAILDSLRISKYSIIFYYKEIDFFLQEYNYSPLLKFYKIRKLNKILNFEKIKIFSFHMECFYFFNKDKFILYVLYYLYIFILFKNDNFFLESDTIKEKKIKYSVLYSNIKKHSNLCKIMKCLNFDLYLNFKFAKNILIYHFSLYNLMLKDKQLFIEMLDLFNNKFETSEIWQYADELEVKIFLNKIKNSKHFLKFL